MAERPRDVASLWIGPRLHYLHRICLASHAAAGHHVTLYAHGLEETPDGVELRPVTDVAPAPSSDHPGAASVYSDLFRYRLLAGSDVIWVDADAYCQRAYPDTAHLFAPAGPRAGLNGGVLALPRDGAALGFLAAMADLRLGLVKHAPDEVARYLDRNHPMPGLAMGPRALDHFLALTGEAAHALPHQAFYPIDRNLIDCFWDPEARVGRRFTDQTYGAHLWASGVRPFWLRHPPPRGSFLWRAARRLGITPRDALWTGAFLRRHGSPPIRPGGRTDQVDFKET